MLLIDPVSFIYQGNVIYDGSVINNIEDSDDGLISIRCRSVYGHSQLRFSSDNDILNDYFSANNFDSSLVMEPSIVTVNMMNDYNIEITIDMFERPLNNNLTCYSSESGESTTIAVTIGKSI